MITIIQTDSTHKDFQKLNRELDIELKVRDGEDAGFYAQFNKIDSLKHVVLAYENHIPIACGAIKEKENFGMEIKRMYVTPEKRGQGIASQILNKLQTLVLQLKHTKCVLETGIKQPEAIQLYKKNGFKVIPNFPPYQNIKNSICFEKILN